MKLIWTLVLMTLLGACASTSKEEITPLTKDISAFEYPYPVQFHQFDSQGSTLKMGYMDVAATGPEKGVIVLLHGKNFSGFYFKTLIDHFKSQGLRVIVPDQIGFGKSTKPLSYQYSFHALGTNTLAMLDALGVTKFKLLGHSMGGMLATRIALMAPKRVSELALVNPIGLEDWKTMLDYRTIDEWYQRELKASVQGMRNYQQKSYYDGVWKPEYEEFLAVNKGLLAGPDWPHMAMISAKLYDMIYTQPVYYEFKNLQVKTLLLLGDRDRTALLKDTASKELLPTLGRYDLLGPKVIKMIPKGELVVLKNLGHMPFVEDFKATTKALDQFFLR